MTVTLSLLVVLGVFVRLFSGGGSRSAPIKEPRIAVSPLPPPLRVLSLVRGSVSEDDPSASAQCHCARDHAMFRRARCPQSGNQRNAKNSFPHTHAHRNVSTPFPAPAPNDLSHSPPAECSPLGSVAQPLPVSLGRLLAAGARSEAATSASENIISSL